MHNGIVDLIDADWCITRYGRTVHIQGPKKMVDGRMATHTLCGRFAHDGAAAPVYGPWELPCERCVAAARTVSAS
jgi:hypothetical protein